MCARTQNTSLLDVEANEERAFVWLCVGRGIKEKRVGAHIPPPGSELGWGGRTPPLASSPLHWSKQRAWRPYSTSSTKENQGKEV